jgi:hypothetical protein
VILASAMTNLGSLAARLRVFDYIAKPYDFDLLLHKIAHAADGKGGVGGGPAVSDAAPGSSGSGDGGSGTRTGTRKTLRNRPFALSPPA